MGLLKALLSNFLAAIFVILVISGGPLVYYFDHSFAGYSAKIGPKIPFLPCCQLAVSIPPGMARRDAQKLAEADSKVLAAQAQATTLRASLAFQNVRIDALSREGDLARSAALNAQAKYQRDLAVASKRSAPILFAAEGPGDVCSRAQKVDAAFLESIQ